jgi:hypothetical protein
MSQELICEVADGIARMKINRPEARNAMTGAVIQGMFILSCLRKVGFVRASRPGGVCIFGFPGGASPRWSEAFLSNRKGLLSCTNKKGVCR